MSKIYYGIKSLDGLCDIWGKWCAKHKVFDNEGNGINPEDVLFEHDLEDSNYNFKLDSEQIQFVKSWQIMFEFAEKIEFENKFGFEKNFSDKDL